MSAREFAEKVAAVNTASRLGGDSYGATIRSAKFSARLEGDTLVDGRALLDVGCSVSWPTTLSLEPCGLAIGEAGWVDQPGKTARLGLGPDDQLKVWLDGPGKLEFDWSLRGRPDSPGGWVFSLAFPRGPATRLVLELPQDTEPVCPAGVVIQAGAGEEGFRLWRIELGGHHLAELRLVPADEADRRQRLPRVRQTTTYHLSSDLVEMTAELEFDVRHEPLRRIRLALDSPLRIVSAELGGKPLDWSVVSSFDQNGLSRVTLEPAEPIEGPPRRITIRALAPLQLDALHRLPRIRPEDVAWRRAEATLRVVRPLVVEQLGLIDARQTSAGVIELDAGTEAEEIFEFQYSSADAGIQILLARREAPVEADTAVAVSLSGSKLAAETWVDLRVANGQRFLLDAEVSPPWSIDSVQTEPADALSDWNVRQSVDKQRILTVRLARPLTPSQPVRLRVVARQLRSPLERVLRGSDLAPVRFLAARGGSNLIALGDVAPYQWDISNEENLVRHDPQRLEPAALRRFTETPRGLVFEDNQAAADLRVSLASRSPAYAAKVKVQATVSGHSLVEKYFFEFEPQGSRIDRVLIRFSQDRAAQLDWILGLGPEDEVVRVSSPHDANEHQESQGDERGISKERPWEIRFHPPRSAKVVIEAMRKSALVDRQPVCLAAMPGAVQQQATLEIRATGSSVVVVDNKRLRPIALEKPPFAEYSPLRAAFHYQAQQDMDPSDAPLTISPGGSEPVGPSAWAWRRRLDSRYQASGLARHLVSYWIESAGRERLELTLPARTSPDEIREVWINGVAGGSGVVEKNNRLSIDLPSGERFVEVRVAFATRGAALRPIGPVRHPELGVDMPVLAKTWTVWLPPGFKVSRETTEYPARSARRLSLTERLLGPLGRGLGENPWDPLPLENWLLAFGGQDAYDNAQRKALRLLERMGESPAAGGVNGGRITWGKLLGDKAIQGMLDDTSNGQSAVALVVDQEALDRAGPTVDTPVRRTAAASGAAQGLAMLRDANLSMLVGTDAILLTSAAEAAVVREQLAPLTDETTYRAEGRPLGRQPYEDRFSGSPQAGANPRAERSLDRNGVERGPAEQRMRSRESRPPSLNLVWRVRAGPLAEELQRSAWDESRGAFTLASRWSQQPAPGATPWRHTYPVGYRPDDVFGWTAYRLDASGASPVELLVVNDSLLRCSRWITMLLVLGFAWWGLLHRPALLAGALGTFAVAALLTPEPYAVVLSGGVLGFLCAFVLRWITPIGRESNRANDSGGSSRRRRLALRTGLLLLAMPSLLAPCPSRAQDPGTAGERPPAQPIYIPADENGQETGDDYHLPTSFHDELLGRAARLTDKPRDWMLSGATYRGKLDWQEGPVKRLALSGPLTAAFDLGVATLGSTVRVHLGGDFRYLDAKLDNRTIQAVWNEEEEFVEFTAERIGWSTLEIKLELKTPPEGASSGFELLVPRLATSRLELDVPEDAPVDIPQCIGALEVVPGEVSIRSRVLARLGPLSRNRLEVRWPSGATRGSSNALPDVDELLWLNVEPGSVTLDAKFTFQIRDTATRRLSVAVDPALQRVGPFLCDQVAILPVEEDPLAANQSRLVHLNLQRSVSNEELVVRARFVVKNWSGVGSLPAPLLETRNRRIARRWLAVSVDPSLEWDYDSLDSRDTLDSVLDTMVFIEEWGETDDDPSFARVLSVAEPTWRLAVRPRAPVTTAEQVLDLDYDSRGADVRFEARLATTVGARFQYRILAPPELEVEDEAHCVSVLAVRSTDADGSSQGAAAGASSPDNQDSIRTVFDEETTVDPTELVRRCSRARDGTITVFLKSPLEGRHVLSLRGRLPTSKPPGEPRRVEAPTFEIDDAPWTSSTIRIFRQPEVKVGLESLTGLSEVDLPSTRKTSNGLGRLVATLASVNQGPIAVSLTVEENHPAIHCDRTTLLVKADVWGATVEFDLRVDQGVVDELVLITPPWWKPSDAPGADIFPIVSSDENQARYRVRPHSAIEGLYRLAVSGPLELAPDGAVRIPDATLEGVTQGKSLLVLPTWLDLEPAARERGQVRKVEVPQRFSRQGADPALELAAYEYQGRSYRAVAGVSEASARVTLADVRITLSEDGTCRGVVTFDLSAAAGPDCLLRVPEGLDVARIDVSDATPMAASQRRGLWRIPLGSGRLPKRIEVVFWGRTSSVDATGGRQVASPWLQGIPVEQTLWTVSTGAGNPRLGDAQQVEQDALALDLVRLRSVGERIKDTHGLADADPAEVALWYRQWVLYWAAVRYEVQRRLADAPADQRQDAALELELREGSQFQLAAALDAEDVLTAAIEETPSGRRMMEFQLSAPDQSRHTAYYAISDDVDSITLAPERAKVAGVSNRMPAAMVLVGLTLLAFFLARRGVCSVWLRRWPHPIGVAAGLAWWMWLSPSFAGLAIALVSLLASFRPGWKYRRQSSSAIVPMGVLDR